MQDLPREESAVFNDLENLCRSPGYIHALAYLSYRDNFVGYQETLTGDDLAELYRPERLIRSEMSTLLGLLIKGDIDFTHPGPKALQGYADQSEHLLEDLHLALSTPMFQGIEKLGSGTRDPELLSHGAVLREPIFYSGESAYLSQYRDLALKKYKKDEDWLSKHCGFNVSDAVAAANAISSLQPKRLKLFRRSMVHDHPDDWTILPFFTFTSSEIALASGLDIAVVRKVMQSFSVSEDERNAEFSALNEFNVANAKPILSRGQDTFVLLQSYSLYEAIYESPFFWMLKDDKYRPEALTNRGNFAELFSAECLRRVFGEKYVHPNVTIGKKEGTRLGEIDTLVVFGDRAIVLQAKSKRLTLEAKKGNDKVLQSDFSKSIQDSYDQALTCARLLVEGKHHIADSSGKRIPITALKKVYLVCLVSDHYPALSFQARQFLHPSVSSEISAPFVMDVFTLDVMSEMLSSPLHFLSYVDRRTEYADKVSASHELTVLSYHLKTNLWVSGEYNLISLQDDISTDLDVAMAVRRDNVPGERTPKGILTRFKHTAFDGLISQIERQARPETLDLGFLLLKMSGEAISQLNQGIERVLQLTKKDRGQHDFSMASGDTGITVHCNLFPKAEAALKLQAHVLLRKYKLRAPSWYGIKLCELDGSLEFGYNAQFAWSEDADMEEASRSLSLSQDMRFVNGKLRRFKVGRNDPCPCRSGKKYKQCHGR
jgi:hypothetical protein